MGTFQGPPTSHALFEETPFGPRVNEPWQSFFSSLADALSKGYTGTVTLAKITGGGANGSLTFTNGILTSVVDPT